MFAFISKSIKGQWIKDPIAFSDFLKWIKGLSLGSSSFAVTVLEVMVKSLGLTEQYFL